MSGELRENNESSVLKNLMTAKVFKVGKKTYIAVLDGISACHVVNKY